MVDYEIISCSLDSKFNNDNKDDDDNNNNNIFLNGNFLVKIINLFKIKLIIFNKNYQAINELSENY